MRWLRSSRTLSKSAASTALTLASELSLRRDAWRFSQIELRVDATRVTGSVAVNPGPRPQIAANLALDRLDLDAYWPGQAPTDLLAAPRRPAARGRRRDRGAGSRA